MHVIKQHFSDKYVWA